MVDGCRECRQKTMVPIMKEKAEHRKALGIPVLSHKKRGRKAYHSRLVNIGLKDFGEVEYLLYKLDKREGNKRRSYHIRRLLMAKSDKIRDMKLNGDVEGYWPPIVFEVRGDPKAQQRHRTGKGFHYDPSKADKSDFLMIAHENIPDTPITGPVHIDVAYYMPIPKTWPKYRKKAAELDNVPHIKRPDIDNLTKFTLDALAPFWNDDCQICLCITSKYYSHTPRTEVKISCH